MSDTAKQSPLGVNSLGSLLQNTGLTINPIATGYMGSSKNYTSYTFGSVVQDTCLRMLTLAINDGYLRGQVDSTTYNNLISIGASTIPALGNSKAPTYTWTGPVNTGDSTDAAAQTKSWWPYNNTNNVTQWGYVRLVALQAWNEFNWNGDISTTTPAYKDFTQSFMQAYSFIEYTNVAINALQSAPSFLKGTYSNMNDLISADITGVSLSTNAFGQDLITSGKVINLQRIDAFGLPSVLLQTLRQYNAISSSISLALIASGLQPTEVDQIISGTVVPSTVQEQRIYGAFLIIQGIDLADALIPLNCKTQGLESLADLLNPMKLFPNSYQTLTVPLFNANPGPTNSKTYYPIYGEGSISSLITSPAVSKEVGTQIPAGTPPIANAEATTSITQTTDTNSSTVTAITDSLTSTASSTTVVDTPSTKPNTSSSILSVTTMTVPKYSLPADVPPAFNRNTTGNSDYLTPADFPTVAEYIQAWNQYKDWVIRQKVNNLTVYKYSLINNKYQE